ncbi:CoA-binding protein [Lewinellaceae bacterium SD302]|nr:CoA-binding protein [Lewinellaceae bacterium SD302]
MTLVLGATPNPSRYANIATKRLLRNGHEVVLVGIKKGEIDGQKILNGKPDLETEIDTVTLYVGPRHQPEYYDYLLRLKPRRIIFNPGTENAELIELAKEAGIKPVVACTLVMLSTGEY